MEEKLIKNIYIGERDFKKIEWDLEIEYWYRDEILSRIWDSKPNHTGIILWPRLDSEGDFQLLMINIMRESLSNWRTGSTKVCYSLDITDFYKMKNKSKTSFKKSEKFSMISNQDNSKIQEVYKVFFDTELNNENPAYIFFPLDSILIKENDITEDLLTILKGINLSFDENKKLKIQSDFNINKFREEE